MTKKEKRNALIEKLSEENEEALLAVGYEEAFIGFGYRAQGAIAIYDYNKCIAILMKRDGMSYEDAVEYFEFNTLGSFVGDHAPVFAEIAD